jgi:hypothetical protein
MGLINEEHGLKGLHPLVSRQVKWVETLKLKNSLEQTPEMSKSEQKRQQIKALLHTDSFLQPKTGNIPNWLLHSISLIIPKDPRAMTEDIFIVNGLGNPIYQ